MEYYTFIVSRGFAVPTPSNLNVQTLIKIIKIKFVKTEHWPIYTHKIYKYKSYLSKRYELAVEENCLVWNNRLIILRKLQKNCIKTTAC